ncbi:hypothetical protein BCR33DRAFT_861821 [Rhizoclosmatium globosum]|uniref:Zn(2)-C6 fungal-type domain-containing protein n=1 Tax=Rhizoclosmatium globosum TaxID=329046 RepID=A0A1Y2AGS7_9FUNG|nr:hypothetical protein BCR33DRAFT_861821 [Rhizoclosmatium globosum]|eukprot:ORY21761.1 hypothetical protein BCR33DRAFT_861821 [Rhizoclosmatium globosum]
MQASSLVNATACSQCRLNKQKCEISSNPNICTRCLKGGRSCDIPQLQKAKQAPQVPKTCARCVKSRKKCVRASPLDACSDCIKRGLEDECLSNIGQTSQIAITTSRQPQFDTLTSHSDNSLVTTNGDKLSTASNFGVHSCFSSSLFLNAMDDSLINYVDYQTELEDPDFIPTIADFYLCANWLRGEEFKKRRPDCVMFDRERFLSRYFQAPAVLRLSTCCWALRQSSQAELCLSYFNRAMKALQRSDMDPSLDLVIACSQLCGLAIDYSQPVVAMKFLVMALKMIIDLKMYIDPADSPWLIHLTLREKEERRHVFWYCFVSYATALANFATQIQLTIISDGVHHPSQVLDPEPIFFLNNAIPFTARLFQEINNLKILFSHPPSSPELLLEIQSACAIQTRLPDKYTLEFDNPSSVTPSDMARFILQCSSLASNLGQLNLILQSALSIHSRPIMFLSIAPLEKFKGDDQMKIRQAINQCLNSAWRIYSLYKFLFTVSTAELVESDELWRYDPYYHACPFLEMVFVFWFFSCRMDPSWMQFTDPALRNPLEISAPLQLMMSKRPLTFHGGAAIPFFTVMKCALDEMEEIARTNVRKRFHYDDYDTNVVEVGMRVMPLGQKDDQASQPVEAICYMGLLGLQIGNKIRWKGVVEDSWRLFWKLL